MKRNTAFSIDEKILQQFDVYAKKKSLNKSLWVENHMKSELKEEEPKLLLETTKAEQ